jgi:carbon storage regulator
VLVLSRRHGESIIIGQNIKLTVLEVRGDVVRLGIDAPRDVDVHREEVFLELQEANRLAASPSSDAVDTLAAGLREAPAAGADVPAKKQP